MGYENENLGDVHLHWGNFLETLQGRNKTTQKINNKGSRKEKWVAINLVTPVISTDFHSYVDDYVNVGDYY